MFSKHASIDSDCVRINAIRMRLSDEWHLFERGSKQLGSVLHPELSLSVEIHSLGMTSQLASIQARDLCIGQIAYR